MRQLINQIASNFNVQKHVWSEAKKSKYDFETEFWQDMIGKYVDWYRGDIRSLYGEKTPAKKEKVKAQTLELSAILTWEKIHQFRKYLEDLDLNENSFGKIKLLDIGSGPHSSALAFKNVELFCLDPLWPKYLSLGFPTFHNNRARIVNSFAETTPFDKNFFDAIISVNALDHVDDFEKTAIEIKRILKPGGKLRFHLHYHQPTKTEPLVLDDDRVKKAFNWSRKFKKINESTSKRGHKLDNPQEKYCLWSNF